MLKELERYLTLINSADQKSLNMSLDNVHAKGMFSLVFGGTEHGKLIRAFITTQKLKLFDIQLHTHRYPITFTSLKGRIAQQFAHPSDTYCTDGYKMSLFNYDSPINGGKGLSYIKDVYATIQNMPMPIGAMANMNCVAFHSVTASKGSIWIVEEHGFITQRSNVLGAPFITKGLYTKPTPSQINNMHELVSITLRELVNIYKNQNSI